MSECIEMSDKYCDHDGCLYVGTTQRREATISIREVEGHGKHWRCGNHAAELVRALKGPLELRRVERISATG
jgi:hypothetical protein